MRFTEVVEMIKALVLYDLHPARPDIMRAAF
jgi:hypothetical protein